jgi:hypothetical protein
MRLHPATTSRLHLDGRVLLDSPTRERRLTLELLALIVQRESLRRHSRTVADDLVQDSRGHLHVDVHHDSLALFQLDLHL